MTSYSAVQGWGVSQVHIRAEAGRLTRRGRLTRTLALLAIALVVVMLGIGQLVGRSVPADDAVGADLVRPGRTVTVHEGDSLWAIAGKVAPRSDPRDIIVEIREINGLTSSRIHPGQVLVVPDGQ
jgi:LysM domain